MTSKPKHDIHTVWNNKERSRSTSGSEHSTCVDAKPGYLVYDERRVGKWHKRITGPPVDGAAPIGGRNRCGASSASSSGCGGRGSGGRPHPTHISARRGQQHAAQLPARPEKTWIVKGLDQDQFLPNHCPIIVRGKDDVGSSAYPPIVTIDGRVDTDLDHLIDDENEEDEHYTGPVEEIPSKYPKPHVFSVIHGSLDDDVDSYANDDGTLEHTLVDAPKNFHPKDLKDVASTDGPGARARPGQTKGGRSGAQTGEGTSHLLNYTDRSHNKMHTDGLEGERSDTCKRGKYPQHHPHQEQGDLLQQLKHEEKKQMKPPRPPPRTSCKTSSDSRRQVHSDESVRSKHEEQASPAAVLSDSFTVGNLREVPLETCVDQRQRNGASCDEGLHSEKPHGYTANNMFRSEEEAMEHNQPTPGKSVSEQTQKSNDDKIALRRPVSYTSKLSRSAKRSEKNFVSSPRKSAARLVENDQGQTDSNDEEYTFITCREAVGKSSATLATESSRHHPHGRGSCLDERGKQRLDQGSRRNMKPRSQRKRRGDDPESDLSSDRGFDSIESDSFELYDPSLSDGYQSSEKYCSDPIGTNGKFTLTDAEMSKSDTRASVDRSTGRRLSQRNRELPFNKHECLPLVVAPMELHGDTPNAPDQRKGKSPEIANSDIQDQVEFYDARESGSQEETKSKSTKNEGQKYFAISKIDSEKGYRSKFLIQEMNASENQMPKEDQRRQQRREQQQRISDGAENRVYDEKQGKKIILEPHLGNTIWHDTERFCPINNPQRETRHESYKNAFLEENKGYHNTRRGNGSPARMRPKHEQTFSRERRRTDDALRNPARRNRSPTKLDWHGYLSSKDRKREMSMLHKKASQIAADAIASPPNIIKENGLLPSPKTWNDIDQMWRRKMAASPGSESPTQNWRGRRRSVRERGGRGINRRSPRASWSFDSDHSPVSYRNASRMIPYRRKRMAQSQREALARTEGTSVDGFYPSPLPKAPIGDIYTKHVGMNSTDEDLKESLKQAMAIARHSLNAAAKVSQALNLVMTNSCLSIDSCSYKGSRTDPRSPIYNLEVTPPNAVLRWSQIQRSPSLSSRNTELSCMSVHRQVLRKPLPHLNETRASSEVVKSREEPYSIGRNNEIYIYPERRRSRSLVSDRERLLTIVPNYNLLANRADGNDASTPLVSIYIGNAGPHQEAQQKPSILSSHIQQDYSQVAGAHENGNGFSKASVQSHKEKVTCSPKEETKEACLLEGHQRFTEMTGNDKISFFPVRTQTVCVNMVTTQGFQNEIVPASKLSESSDSQVYESTKETLKIDKEYSKTKSSLYGDDKTKKDGSNFIAKTDYLAMHKNENGDDIPTHEDGSQRHDRFVHPRETSPPTKLAEKICSHFGFLGPPDSHSATMSAALNYLTQYPQSFSPPHPLFRPLSPLSPVLAGTVLCPDKMSSPSSVYSSASAGDAMTNREKIYSAEESPCSMSIGSCVDPINYLKGGSEVDPPKQKIVANKNVNKSHQKSLNIGAKVVDKNPGKPEDSLVAKMESELNSEDGHFLTINSNHVKRTKDMRKSTQRGKHKSKCDADMPCAYKQDHIIDQSRNPMNKEHIDSKKVQNRRKRSHKQCESGNTSGFENIVQNQVNDPTQNNLNNNSARDEHYKDNLPDSTTNRSDSVDDLVLEVNANEEGACAPDRNQNQPLYHLLPRSPQEQSLSKAMFNISGDSWPESVVQNKTYMSKSKDRYKRVPPSYRVRKSLCVAMKLAEESLSAAAKVSQLLNQVVDVYQDRHPMNTEDIARLAVQNHAMIDGILASAGYIKSRGTYKLEAGKYERDNQTKIERLSHRLNFPDDRVDVCEPQRHRYNRPNLRRRQDVRFTSSPRYDFRTDRIGDVPNLDKTKCSRDNRTEQKGERLERRRSTSREARKFREFQTRSPSPENKRTKQENSPKKKLESNGEHEKSIGGLDSPKECDERYARDKKYSAQKIRHEKYNYRKNRHSEEENDRDHSSRGSPRNSLKNHRESRRGERREGGHREERKLNCSRRELENMESHSDGERQELSQASSKAHHKSHKSSRETDDFRVSSRSPDTKRHHIKYKDGGENRKENGRPKESREASTRFVDQKGVKNKTREEMAEEFPERRRKDREGNDKVTTKSPRKTTKRYEDIKNIGSSVDSPRSSKTKQRSVETVEDSVQKSRHTGSPEIYADAARKENGHQRSQGANNGPNKNAPKGESIADAAASNNSGSGDTGPLKNKPRKHEHDRSQPQEGETLSRRNQQRGRKPKSRSDLIKLASKLARERPKSSPVDDPSFFQKVAAAAASMSVPATNTDGKDCSYNRSVDGASCSEQQLSIPVKHRYPFISEKGKTLLVKWESSKIQQSQDESHSPSHDNFDPHSSCSENTKCLKTDTSGKWAYKKANSMDQCSTAKPDPKKRLTTPCRDQQNESKTFDEFNRNKRKEDSSREEITFVKAGQPTVLKDNCTDRELVNPTASRGTEYVSPESCDSPSSACGNNSTDSSTVKMNLSNQNTRSYHSLKELPTDSKTFPPNDNRCDNIPSGNGIKKFSITVENEKDYLAEWMYNRGVANDGFESGKSSELRPSYTTYDDESPDSSSSSEEEEPVVNQAAGSSREDSSSNFSSPEKPRAQNVMRNRVVNTRFVSQSRQDMRVASPENSDRGGTYSGLRRENSFNFAESPARNDGKNFGGQQTMTSCGLAVPSESDRETPAPREESPALRKRRNIQEIPRRKLQYSSGDSMRSFTVSASVTETDEDNVLSHSDHSSPIGRPPQLQGRTMARTANQRLHPSAASGNETRRYPDKAASITHSSSALPQPQSPEPVRDPQRMNFSVSPQHASFNVDSQSQEPQITIDRGGSGEIQINVPDDARRGGIALGATELTGPSGRGLYSLYRPLDNMRPGSFSPIIEESEVLTAGYGMSDHLSSSSSSLYTRKVRPSKHSNTNNCNVEAVDSKHDNTRGARNTIHCDVNFGSDVVLLNSNNNASADKDFIQGSGNIGRDAVGVESKSDINIAQIMPRRKLCISQPVIPEPFCRPHRFPLPPLKPPPLLKLAKPLGNLTEHDQWILNTENKKLCERLVEVRKAGCTFDIGMKKPYKRSFPMKSLARMTELEIIARENEKLLRRIINKESHYKREEQLNDYDKKLPKLLSFSRYPKELIKNRKLQFM